MKSFCIPLADGGFICHTSYSVAIEEAERRHRRGERQLFCWDCYLWRWPDECDHKERSTAKEFKALERRMDREIKLQRLARLKKELGV